MPIAGIPEVLENLIVSVCKTHHIGTWNIFNEENGNITFRLRFKIQDQDHINQQQGTQCITYRKKTETHINRDRQRATKRQRVISPESVNSSPELENIRTMCSNEDC